MFIKSTIPPLALKKQIKKATPETKNKNSGGIKNKWMQLLATSSTISYLKTTKTKKFYVFVYSFSIVFNNILTNILKF